MSKVVDKDLFLCAQAQTRLITVMILACFER